MKKDPVLKTMAKNLKKARLARHMTQAGVARTADIAPNHYARIERGEVVPSVLTLVALIRSLKVRYSDVLPK